MSWRLAVASLLLLALAPTADAHGPTVRVAFGSVVPASLTVRVGDTVHFTNGNASGVACTLVFDDDDLTSPAITRPEGWHHTFEKAGRHAFHLKEMVSSKGEIVVVED